MRSFSLCPSIQRCVTWVSKHLSEFQFSVRFFFLNFKTRQIAVSAHVKMSTIFSLKSFFSEFYKMENAECRWTSDCSFISYKNQLSKYLNSYFRRWNLISLTFSSVTPSGQRSNAAMNSRFTRPVVQYHNFRSPESNDNGRNNFAASLLTDV